MGEEVPERSRGARTREAGHVAVVTADLARRLRRVLVMARANAAGGRYPQVLEDANVLAARLLDTDGCDSATTVGGASTLDSGELLSVTAAARLIGCSPQMVRKAIGSSRLAAAKVAGVWMIRRADLEQYRYRKART